MSQLDNLQESFIEACQADKVPVSIYLINGIKLQGTISNSDRYTLVLSNSVPQLVYKHAISTIVPTRQVNWKKD